MHCSSLGEFEQGRMILEGLRLQLPDIYIYFSFFSPSGYEIRHNWVIANKVFYLPVDTDANARLIIGKLRPDCIILVKYDFLVESFTKGKRCKDSGLPGCRKF
ncbi:MAG: hypothetical protein IPG79_06835 [Saprospiraceae bacterium]|nr:hypothetical protein [Saprospiraceae bacterium]